MGAAPPPSAAAFRKIYGDDVRSLIEAQLVAHGEGLLSVLARYRRTEAMTSWHETIRAVEEFINLPRFGIEDLRARAWLCAIPLDDRLLSDVGSVFRAVREKLSPRFDAGVVGRYLQTMLQTAVIASAFRTHGQTFGPGIKLDTVGAAVAYFQSRRRHMVSLLYTMPFACKGTDVLVPLDTLNVLLPQVEHSCVTITGFHIKLAQLEILDDFSMEVDEVGAMASHGFDTLDENFLEPERASIQVMTEHREDQIVLPPMEELDAF